MGAKVRRTGGLILQRWELSGIQGTGWELDVMPWELSKQLAAGCSTRAGWVSINATGSEQHQYGSYMTKIYSRRLEAQRELDGSRSVRSRLAA